MQKQLGTNYMVELAYVGSQGRNMLLKGDPNQAPPVVGVTDQNVNRPYAAVSPALRSIGQVQSTGTLDYHGFFVKFQRRFADNFSVLNSYTWNKVDRPELGQRRRRDADQRLRSAVQPRPVRLRRHAHAELQLGLRAAVRSRAAGAAAGRPAASSTCARACRFTVTQTQGVQSTGTGNRPNRIADGAATTRRSSSGSTRRRSSSPADITGTYGDAGRNILRGPGQFNIDFSVIKSTRSAASTPSSASRRSTC